MSINILKCSELDQLYNIDSLNGCIVLNVAFWLFKMRQTGQRQFPEDTRERKKLFPEVDTLDIYYYKYT